MTLSAGGCVLCLCKIEVLEFFGPGLPGLGGCNGKGYTDRTNLFTMPLYFEILDYNSRFFACYSQHRAQTKCALTPSDPKIRAGKFNIFALTRAVLRTLKKRVRPAP